MKFISKSIIRKLIFHLFWAGVLIAALCYYFYYSKREDVPYYVLIGSLIFIVLFFVLVYFVDVVRPLRIVLVQVQALLSNKPYKGIYTTRVDEIGILAHFFNQVTKGVGQVSVDLKDRERMLDELNVASTLQRDILPLINPSVEDLQIVAKNKPATELGGDNFNIFTKNDKTYIYIGDVTGHGVSAGLIMTMVYSLISVFSDLYSAPYDIMVNVNRYIKRYVKKTMFMTMLMLCFDHKTKQMSYVGAGHEHILIYQGASGECEAVLTGGVALGMVADNSKVISEKLISLEDGDFVVLYTDGITEARNNDGELYGLDRLKSAVREYASQYTAEGVNYHIAKDVTAFMQAHKQDDDMTLIVIKRDSKFVSSAESIRDTSWQN